MKSQMHVVSTPKLRGNPKNQPFCSDFWWSPKKSARIFDDFCPQLLGGKKPHRLLMEPNRPISCCRTFWWNLKRCCLDAVADVAFDMEEKSFKRMFKPTDNWEDLFSFCLKHLLKFHLKLQQATSIYGCPFVGSNRTSFFRWGVFFVHKLPPWVAR